MVNNGYSRDLALQTVADGKADLIAFGRSFISTPDLVRRLREGAALNELRADKLFLAAAAEGWYRLPTLAAIKKQPWPVLPVMAVSENA